MVTPKKQGRLPKAASQHPLTRLESSEKSKRGWRALRAPSRYGPYPYYAAQHFRG
jgi:hypothetical protein